MLDLVILAVAALQGAAGKKYRAAAGRGVGVPAQAGLLPMVPVSYTHLDAADRPRGETKECPVCHADVEADALFCNHCGAHL